MHSKITRPQNCLLLLVAIWSPTRLSAQLEETEQPATPPLPAITFEDGIHTIFDSQLREHAFQQRDDGRFTAVDLSSGALSFLPNGAYRWVDESGRTYYLTGSQSLEIRTEQSSDNRERPPSETHTGKTKVTGTKALTGVTEPSTSLQHNRTTTYSSQFECLPSGSGTPDKNTEGTTEESGSSGESEAPVESEAPETTNEFDETSESDESEQCDTSAEGPYTFQSSPFTGPNTTLDARPASCQSYFVQYYGTDRGFEIEAGLHVHAPYSGMEATLRTFPVIDFIDGDRLYVVHSRDLGNRTFNSTSRPDALLKQLLKDGEEIQTRFLDVLDAEGSISASELGQSTTIGADQLKPVTLQLIIRDGIASASHWKQIETARKELMERHGIILEVVVIP